MIQVFSKEWFEKHQRILLKIANSCLGEFVFRFKKMGHYTKGRKIARILPNSIATARKKGNKIEVTEQFFRRNEYALKLYYMFFPIWWICHAWDIVTRPIPQFNLGFDTLTVYPDAGGGGANTSVDGFVGRDYVSESWATIWASAGTMYNKTATNDIISRINSYGGTWRYNYQGVITFLTSGLTSGVIISNAVLSLYGTAVSNDFDTAVNLDIVATTPTAVNDLQASDFSQFGSTSFAVINSTAWNTSGYNDFTLNASGIANISKTGTSCFGATMKFVEPNVTSGSQAAQFVVYQSDNGSNKPKLVVTYTLPVTSGFFLFF